MLLLLYRNVVQLTFLILVLVQLPPELLEAKLSVAKHD